MIQFLKPQFLLFGIIDFFVSNFVENLAYMNLTLIWNDTLKILKDSSVYKYMIPGVLVTLIYVSFMWSIGAYDSTEEVDTEALGWFGKLSYWLMSGVKWFTTMLFQFVVITLFSPFMAMLSERCDTILTGRVYEFSIQRLTKEILRTTGILVTGFLFSVVVIMLWYLVAWIGNLSALTDYIVFILKAFFIGFYFIDYSLERNMISILKSWQYGISKPLIMIVLGVVFSLLFMIPIFGAVLATFLTTIISSVFFVHDRKDIC